MSNITVDTLRELVSFDKADQRVAAALAAANQSDAGLVRFMNRYAKWNCRFAAGVARLVSNVGDAVELFTEPGKPIGLADRSCYIASFFFDAARDEFNDHITRHRDPHRSLAQATLIGMAQALGQEIVLHEPTEPWLRTLADLVVHRYDGSTTPVRYTSLADKLFSGIGFHLGSEILADSEFSMIDDFLRTNRNDLVQSMLRTKVALADAEHRSYAWIGVHSGHDGAAEADHFEWGLQGANLALQHLEADQRAQAVQALKSGFMHFADMHYMFFWLAPKE